jgi:hypothetical protein
MSAVWPANLANSDRFRPSRMIGNIIGDATLAQGFKVAAFENVV